MKVYAISLKRVPMEKLAKINFFSFIKHDNLVVRVYFDIFIFCPSHNYQATSVMGSGCMI